MYCDGSITITCGDSTFSSNDFTYLARE